MSHLAAPRLHDLFVQHATGFAAGQFGTCQGNDQIQLRAVVVDKSDAAKHAVNLLIGTEPVEKHRRHAAGLQQQISVLHGGMSPLRVGNYTTAEVEHCIDHKNILLGRNKVAVPKERDNMIEHDILMLWLGISTLVFLVLAP